MGVHVVAVHRPRPAQQERLEAEVAEHVALLRRVGLATDRPSTALRAPDGTIIEHFEWSSRDAIATAHEHADIQRMWGRFEECCTDGTLADLPNAGVMFAEFDQLGSY